MNENVARQLDAELMVQGELLLALVQTHPAPKEIHLAFLERMKTLLANIPTGTDEDLVVEIRARMAQTSLALTLLTAPTASG